MPMTSIVGRRASARWLGCLALGLLSGQARGQAPGGWALKATPQHLVLSGFWLEAEHMRPGHPAQTLTLGPQLYWGPTGRPDVAFDLHRRRYNELVRGAGLQGQHRFYLSEPSAGQAFATGFYLGYSPQVQFFRLHFSRNDQWHEETGPGGLPYLVYGPLRYHENVLRYGVAGQAGYQLALASWALLDVYAGVGVRKSHSWSTLGESQFRSGPSDYAHQGIYFPAGFKLGIVLR
jgi:hypothetical protein